MANHQITLYILCMEKLIKLPFRTSELAQSARTNFNTPIASTLCSSREKLPPTIDNKPKRKFHFRTDSSSNLTHNTHNDFLKVRPQPLRSTQDKFLRNSQLVDRNCHKEKSPRPNYFQQGKIVHRQIDWIAYNIANYMVTLWVKNQRTFQALKTHFYPNQQQGLDKLIETSVQQPNQNIKSRATIPQTNQNSQKDILPFINFFKIIRNMNLGHFNFSSILDSNSSKQQYQIKQLVDLMFPFPFKERNFVKNQLNFKNFGGPKNIKKVNPQAKNNLYKILVEQKDPIQTLEKITARNQQLLPILMDFSRKILLKKENILIQKLLKNQKLDDFILDSLSFDDKVKMYENILVKRMDDFKLLKDSYIKMTASTEEQMKNNKKLISEFISKGKVKCQTSKNVLIKSIHFDEILSHFKTKVIEPQQPQPLLPPSQQVTTNIIKARHPTAKLTNISSNRGENDKYSSRQLHFGVSSVNIQFGQKSLTNVQVSAKPTSRQQKKRLTFKKQRLSFLNFDEIAKKNQLQIKKQKRPILKSIKSIRNVKQPEQQEIPNLRSFFQTKKCLEPQKTTRRNVKSKTRPAKHKNSIASSFKTHQRKNSSKHDQFMLDDDKVMKNHRNHDISTFKITDKNLVRQLPSKKKFQLAEQKRNYFLKNKRKGIKFSPFTTKQFLKYLHDRNISKFTDISSDLKSDQNETEGRDKSKYFTTDNSPLKRDPLSPTQKFIKGNWRKDRKDSDRNIRKRVQKRKSNKTKQQNLSAFSPSPSQSEVKTQSRLKRLKFEGQNLLHHKILQKILRQKVMMDQQKNSYVVRDKMTGYFNRLLQSGMFEQGGMAEHKQNVENLIRNYDQRRRNANLCRTLSMNGQKNDGEKVIDEFNINVKLRHDDPQIFERLRQIHSGFKKQQEPSMFQKPVTLNDKLQQQLNQFRRNQQQHRRHSHAQFDLQFSDFFSPIRTRYENDEIDEKKEMRDSKDDEEQMLQFMKRLIKKSYGLLGQKDI